MKNLRLFMLVLFLFPGFLAAQDADAQAAREREARRERILSHETRIESILEEAKKRKEATGLFRQEFAFESRVYYLEWVTPDTARNFIERELKSYHLAKNSHNFAVAQIGDYSVVPGDRLEAGALFVDKVQERATVISNMNAVLVEARPETLKAVEELLKKVDETVQKETKRQGISISQIEVIFLKAEPASAAASAPGEGKTSTALQPAKAAGGNEENSLEKLLQERQAAAKDGTPVTITAKEAAALMSQKPANLPVLSVEDIVQQYGVDAEDMKMFNVERVRVLGRTMLAMMHIKGDMGKAKANLGTWNAQQFTVTLDFIEERDQDLALRLLLESRGEVSGIVTETELLTSTVLMRKDDGRMLLGLTNLNDTLLLIVRRSGGAAKE